MANIKSAIKRARQNVKCRHHNAARRSMLRTHIKNVLKAIHAGDKKLAQSTYQTAVSVIDRMAKTHIIHRNKASRHKKRLNAKIKAMA